MKYLFLWITLLTFCGSIQAQQPNNDPCAGAEVIHPGQMITGITNIEATKGYVWERPDTFPITCIQTLENDLWYKFTAEEGTPFYEVLIISHSCNTPLGLQALLIRTDDCNNKNYEYVACANKINTDTISLLLEDPEPGAQYLIYIDGYNGTLCEFDVWLKGKDKMTAEDYRTLRFDYHFEEPTFGPLPGLQTEFKNNQSVIHWESSPEDGASFFMVELHPNRYMGANPYARVVGIINPINRVGAGMVQYKFVDRVTPFRDGETYRYRILLVDEEGQRTVFDDFEVEARMVQGFHLTEIVETQSDGVYMVRYLSQKKKQDFEFWVFDDSGKEIKHLFLEKVTQKDNELTIKMQEEPAGLYILRCSNGKEVFEREFLHE